jgi:hypothetical protein
VSWKVPAQVDLGQRVGQDRATMNQRESGWGQWPRRDVDIEPGILVDAMSGIRVTTVGAISAGNSGFDLVIH